MSSNEESSIDTPPPTPSQYPTLFEQYVVRSIQATLDAIPADALFLAVEVRDRAMHLLSFGLEVDAAWAHVRDLILCIAPKMEQAGHREDWMDYLERGVALSRAQNDRNAEAELSLSIGELMRLRSEFELARQWLNGSIAKFAALNEKQGEARALNELAFVAWQQNRFDETEYLVQTALTLLDEADPERATCFSRLGLVEIERQRWGQAERYHRSALQIRQMYSDRRKIGWSLQNLGYAMRGQGEYAEAINYYEQAIAILDELNDVVNCAIAQMNLGITHSFAKQPKKALDIYILAERIFVRFYDIYNLAKVLTSKGIDYLTLRDYVQAENAFIASISLFQQINDTRWQLNALDGLGSLYLEQGENEKASNIFRTAISELPKISESPIYTYLENKLHTHLEKARPSKETGIGWIGT